MATREDGMKPRLLLVEDDATTAAFLRVASEALPAVVVHAGTAGEAATLVGAGHFDLWLIDAHLPDGSGIDLLRGLRTGGHDTPALAHTASTDAGSHRELRVAGFAAVVSKPVSAAQWQQVLRDLLSQRGAMAQRGIVPPDPAHHAGEAIATTPVWDDAAATRALGGNTHVASMRGLLLGDLPAQRAAILAGDADARQRELHKLRAACGLTGATRLAAAVLALQQAPDCREALQAFDAAAQETLAAP